MSATYFAFVSTPCQTHIISNTIHTTKNKYTYYSTSKNTTQPILYQNSRTSCACNNGISSRFAFTANFNSSWSTSTKLSTNNTDTNRNKNRNWNWNTRGGLFVEMKKGNGANKGDAKKKNDNNNSSDNEDKVVPSSFSARNTLPDLDLSALGKPSSPPPPQSQANQAPASSSSDASASTQNQQLPELDLSAITGNENALLDVTNPDLINAAKDKYRTTGSSRDDEELLEGESIPWKAEGKSLSTWIQEAFALYPDIQWPQFKDVFKQSLLVLVVIVGYTAFVYAEDKGLRTLQRLLFGVIYD